MATMTIEQAAKYLHISVGRLAEKAAKGQVPAYKPFKSWLFYESDLENFVREKSCRSINKPVQTAGLSISPSMGNVLDEALAPRPSKRRRSTTTG